MEDQPNYNICFSLGFAEYEKSRLFWFSCCQPDNIDAEWVMRSLLDTFKSISEEASKTVALCCKEQNLREGDKFCSRCGCAVPKTLEDIRHPILDIFDCLISKEFFGDYSYYDIIELFEGRSWYFGKMVPGPILRVENMDHVLAILLETGSFNDYHISSEFKIARL